MYYTVNQLKSCPFGRSLETATLRTPIKAVAESADQESQIIGSDPPTDESVKTQNSVNASKASSKTSSIVVSQVSSTVSSVAVSRVESRVSSKVTSKTSSKPELEPKESTADNIEETVRKAIEESSEDNIEEEEAVPENERPVYRSKISLKERHANFTSYIP